MHKMNPLARGIHRNIDYRRMRSGEPASEDGDADVPQESPSQNRLRLGLIRRNSQAGAGGGGHHETSSHDSKGSGKVHTDRKVGVDDPEQVITATVVPAVNQQSSSSQVVRWDGEFPSGFSTSAAAAPDVILNEHNPPSQPNRHASMDSLLTSGTYEDVILNADHGTGNRRASMNSLITSGTANTHTQTRDTEVPLGPTITRPNNTVRHNSARSFRVPPTVCTTTSSFASLEQVEKPSITSPQMAWSRRVGVGHKMNSEKTINTVTTSGTTGTPNSGGNINNRSLPNNYPSNITISSPVSRSPSILQNQEVSPPSRQERMGFRQIVDEQERGRRRQEKHELTLEGLQRPSPPQRAASSSEDETEEDRMLRLTMEVSLREFEEKHRSAPALPPSRSEISANSSVSPSRSHNHSSSSPLLHRQNSTHSFTTSTTEEITEVLVEHPHRPTLQRRQSSNARIIIPRSATLQHSVSQQLEAARAHLSTEEAEEIERALREAGESLTPLSMSPAAKGKAVRATMSLFAEPSDQLAAAEHLSSSDAEAIERAIRDADEAAEVERAIREADELEQQRSINVALRLQAEEFARQNVGRQPQGNVRVMTHAEMMQSQFVGAQRSQSPPRVHSLELEEQRQGIGVHRSNSPMRVHPLELEEQQRRAFQMNPNPNFDGESDWNRRDRSTVVGPNNEIRTKHDLELKGQLNAERLGLEVDEDIALVGNTAFNSFKQSMSRGTKKGVATQGTGRATTDTDQTKAGAMDSKVRLAITRALNNGLIDKCNGVVKEGKEAVVYHADRGPESSRFDVAVKVFKRIQEFRGRGDYVDGDPRYNGRFRDASAHEQLNIWAEKEFRNLIRANRARVPVPSPLQQKDNIVFMRFMGENGWPAPQLRDLEVRRGSKTWTMLYSQIMVAIRR
jgi:serine/threonine-protein kinase RIO1